MNDTKVKVAICQMPVIPGRPDLNTYYMEKEIKKAIELGAEIIVFPEMCIPGYLIGDMYEDEAFVLDVLNCNLRIRYATRDCDIAVVFGSLDPDLHRQGEDGRLLKSNAILVAQNGDWLHIGEKTLQPNYRIFDDERHFISKRKLRERLEYQAQTRINIEELFEVIQITTKSGVVKVGVIACEDMWDKDYPFSPTEILVKKGAELIINVSASPWTWQKNRKRHSVVKELLAKSPVPLIYVNNSGVQNNGKNLIIFDGSSTVYNAEGGIALEVAPFFVGTETFDLSWNMPVIETAEVDDTTQLYQALHYGVKQFLLTMPPERHKMVIGLSGGIDSALAAAFYVNILGPKNVFLFNLPTKFNSSETKSIADEIATNLGAYYEVIPIQSIVDEIARATHCNSATDELTYENIQARVRMEILAAKAQQLGGLFSANGNKVETAFGYATMYGDIAGYLAAFGDLVKREVYQLADYYNRVVFDRPVIPQACFDIAPMAELRRQQKDPFDYGNLHRCGYHDEMVRAFTEFRWNPEQFVEKYLNGQLESELRLEPGTLNRLFKNSSGFIDDLEMKWGLYIFSVTKRIQAPAIPIVTKRAFGFDLRESMLRAHFTARYHQLKELALKTGTSRKRIAIFGGSFNPPGLHHQQIVKILEMFDQVIIVPCGKRPDKPSANILPLEHRLAMIKLAFVEDERIKLDLNDLEQDAYTPTYQLEELYASDFPEAEIWHVVGEDIVAGGCKKRSEIHHFWNHGREIWDNLNWAVLTRDGYGANTEDLPPNHMLIEIDGLFGSGTKIRDRIKAGLSINNLVAPEIAEYIHQHNLYQK